MKIAARVVGIGSLLKGRAIDRLRNKIAKTQPVSRPATPAKLRHGETRPAGLEPGRSRAAGTSRNLTRGDN